MYKLIIAPQAQKELKAIKKSHKQAITLALKDILEDPSIGKSLTRELTDRYSYRVGVYRIIYKVNKQDQIIHILTAGHRANVYK